METSKTGYVYAYLDPRKDYSKFGEFEFIHEPYYIGMSSGDPKRLYAHMYEALQTNSSTRKANKIRKIIRETSIEECNSNIIILKSGLTTEEAKSLEIKYIQTIGRLDKNTGPLTNLTDGGDGWFNFELTRKQTAIRGRLIIDTRSPRSCYSYNPEYSKASVSESMKEFFHQNRNKTLSDIPTLKYRRFYSADTKVQGGFNNGNSSYYYLVITPDGGYHLSGKGSMRYLASVLAVAHTTIECSARDNQCREDEKFTRIMRGKGIGLIVFRFKTLKECPVNITMGNQQPS